MISDEKFYGGCAFLEKSFGRPAATDTKVIEFYQHLHEVLDLTMNDESFTVAAYALAGNFIKSTMNPWPQAAHFNKAGKETPEDRALRVLTKFRGLLNRMNCRESYDFGDKALHATVRSFGGLKTIFEKGFWDINHNRFLETYKTFVVKTNLGDQGRHIAGELEPFRITSYKAEGKVYLPKWFGYGGQVAPLAQIETRKGEIDCNPEIKALVKKLVVR